MACFRAAGAFVRCRRAWVASQRTATRVRALTIRQAGAGRCRGDEKLFSRRSSAQGHPRPRADGHLQRHARFVQRRRPSTSRPRRRARGWTSSSPRGPTSSTSAASRRGPARRAGAGAGAARARPRAWCVTRSSAARACRSTPRAPEVAAACLDAGRLRRQRRVVPARRGARPRRRRVGRGARPHARPRHAEGHAGLQPLPGRRLRRRGARRVRRVGERGRAGARPRACARDAIVMDPGLGFAKNARHSLELLARLGELVARGRRAGRRRARAASRSSPRRRRRTSPARSRAPRRVDRGGAPRGARGRVASCACTTCARRARPSTSSAPRSSGAPSDRRASRRRGREEA